MDYGSLIRTLEWAYWKQQRNLERKRRKSSGKTWLMTKKKEKATDKEKGPEKDEKVAEAKRASISTQYRADSTNVVEL